MTTPDHVLATLIEARDRIADPVHWTQRTLARNAAGQMVSSYDLDAVQFCANGSVNRCQADPEVRDDALDYLGIAARRLFGCLVPEAVNDQIGHDAVMAMFAEAIRLKKSEIQGDVAKNINA